MQRLCFVLPSSLALTCSHVVVVVCVVGMCCALCRMYYHFRPDCWYWILMILGRKLMIAVTSLMFNKNPAFQMAIALLVLFVCYALQVRGTPYGCACCRGRACGRAPVRWCYHGLLFVCVAVMFGWVGGLWAVGCGLVGGWGCGGVCAGCVQVRCTPYMSMSERAGVITDHRSKAMLGNRVHASLAASLAEAKRAGRRGGGGASMDAQKAKHEHVAVSFFW